MMTMFMLVSGNDKGDKDIAVLTRCRYTIEFAYCAVDGWCSVIPTATTNSEGLLYCTFINLITININTNSTRTD